MLATVNVAFELSAAQAKKLVNDKNVNAFTATGTCCARRTGLRSHTIMGLRSHTITGLRSHTSTGHRFYTTS